MKFWKFEYEGPEALSQCIRDRRLPSGDRTFPGLINTHAHPATAMKKGDGVVIATLQGDRASIFAVGRVRQTATEASPAIINWALAKATVFPEPAGLVNWQQKSAFEISPEPAKRYGLERMIQYYVERDSTQQTDDRG